jgi:hypothetical protein
MIFSPAIAIGPDDEVVFIEDVDILDDEDEGPSSLDYEALHDDAC